MSVPVCKVEAALGNNWGDTNPSWFDITAEPSGRGALLTKTIVRGKSHELQQQQAGTCDLLFTNFDDRFNWWNTASPYWGNLLTQNQADVETDTTGHVADSNCNIAQSTNRAAHGSASILMTSASSGTMNGSTNPTLTAILPNTQYTGMAYFSAQSAQRNVRVVLRWYDSGSSFISQNVGSNSGEGAGAGFVGAWVVATSPSNAAFADLLYQVLSTGSGEQHYVDAFGIVGGSQATTGTWRPGGRGGDIAPLLKVRVSDRWNLLTANQADLETDTTGHVAALNCTIAQSNARSAHGTFSLQLTAGANGDMNGTTNPILSSGIIAGQTYTGVCWFSAQSTLRNVRTVIRWYNSSGTFLSQSLGSTVGEASGVGFTQTFVTAQAPTGATQADILYQILACSAGEQHYVDALAIMPGSDATWSQGGPYYRFTGYLEALTPSGADVATQHMTLHCVDGFKILNYTKLVSTAFHDAQMNDQPQALYRLGENSQSTNTSSAGDGSVHITTVDVSGNGRNGIYFGTPRFGASSAMPTDADTACDFGTRAAYSLLPQGASPSGTSDFTVELFANPRSFPTVDLADRLWSMPIDISQQVQLSLKKDGTVHFAVNDGTNGGTIDSSTQIRLNRWTHIVAVKQGVTGPSNWHLYFDGVEVTSGASLIGNGNCNLVAETPMIAGKDIGGGVFTPQAAFDGFIDEFAIYPTALSAAQVSTHFGDTFSFTTAQLTGTRINKLLDLIGWPSAARNIDAGQFLMRVPSPLYQKTALQYLNELVNSEGFPAQMFIDGAGNFVFQDRAHTQPTSAATFGDNTGELHPASYDTFTPTFDDLDIYNTVTAQAEGGTPKTASDATSVARYGPRSPSNTTNLQNASDVDVLALAQAARDRYKTPQTRLKQLSLHATADPSPSALYPAVIGRELGDRITVNKHTTPGRGAALSVDNLVEGLTETTDYTVGDHHATWQLAPIQPTTVTIIPVNFGPHIGDWFVQPGNQALTVPNGTYDGAHVDPIATAAAHANTGGLYNGWLVLVAQSNKGVTLDLSSTGMPLGISGATNRKFKIMLVGFAIQNGDFNLFNSQNFRFWQCSFTFPIGTWLNQYVAAGGSPPLFNATVINSMNNPNLRGISTVGELAVGSPYNKFIGAYGCDFDNIGNDAIYSQGTSFLDVIGCRFRRVFHYGQSIYRDASNTPGTQLFHSDCIQDEWGTNIRTTDCFIGGDWQFEAHDSSIKAWYCNNNWNGGSENYGMALDPMNHSFNDCLVSNNQWWGNGQYVDGSNNYTATPTYNSGYDVFFLAFPSLSTTVPPSGVTMSNNTHAAPSGTTWTGTPLASLIADLPTQANTWSHTSNPANVWTTNNPYSSWSTYFGAGRTVTDAVLNSSTTVTSNTANFTAADIGKGIQASSPTNGYYIPAGATITGVTDSHTITISSAASGSESGATLVIGSGGWPS